MTHSISKRGLSDLTEVLAEIEHERWAHWQRYMHGKGKRLQDGSLVIPAELVERWERQLQTPYSDLDETEKQSDRNQVERYLQTILNALGVEIEDAENGG
jgi:RNA polymerase-interacting CarD/CdnL/TRCF family regulator